MSNRTYAIGVDFGAESGRSVLVDVRTGRELATPVCKYSHGVIDEALPVEGKPARPEADWTWQDPAADIRTLLRAVSATLRTSCVHPAAVIDLGIDFTVCTMLAVLADDTPLCQVPEFRRNPHAGIKLEARHA